VALSPPGITDAAGSKNVQGSLLPIASVTRERKNAQIYIIKQAKKTCSVKKHSEDVVSGDEHTTSRQKFKNYSRKCDLNI
jgi:hypothetical protein